jgi:hypothetical protein
MLEQNGFLSADCQNFQEIKTKIYKLIEQWEETGLPDLTQASPLTVEGAVRQLMEIRNDLLQS